MRGEVSNLREFPVRQMTGVRPQREKSLAARILRAGYIAEIIRDGISDVPLYHWIVQAAESGEVLALGQSRTLGEAELSAVSFLDDLRLRRAV
jgi:hypothetical protein